MNPKKQINLSLYPVLKNFCSHNLFFSSLYFIDDVIQLLCTSSKIQTHITASPIIQKILR